MQTTTADAAASANSYIYVRWNRERKQQQQQSNTTFGGKLIDFGAIQWLWKVLQRIINYLELDNTRTHTHTDTVELIRNISQSEQKNEIAIASLETHFDCHRWSFFEFDFLILHAKYAELLLGKGIHKNGWCSGLVNLNVLCQKLNFVDVSSLDHFIWMWGNCKMHSIFKATTEIYFIC